MIKSVIITDEFASSSIVIPLRSTPYAKIKILAHLQECKTYTASNELNDVD